MVVILSTKEMANFKICQSCQNYQCKWYDSDMVVYGGRVHCYSRNMDPVCKCNVQPKKVGRRLESCPKYKSRNKNNHGKN